MFNSILTIEKINDTCLFEKMEGMNVLVFRPSVTITLIIHKILDD